MYIPAPLFVVAFVADSSVYTLTHDDPFSLISAHDLEIERGRYIGLKAHARRCKLCTIDIEDECHFLLQCPKFKIERKEIYSL
jgi:hypothetical protein